MSLINLPENCKKNVIFHMIECSQNNESYIVGYIGAVFSCAANFYANLYHGYKCYESYWNGKQVTTENLNELSDFALYQTEFLRLFGFGVEGVDYTAESTTLVDANFSSVA